jgi:hypothetical protein
MVILLFQKSCGIIIRSLALNPVITISYPEKLAMWTLRYIEKVVRIGVKTETTKTKRSKKLLIIICKMSCSVAINSIVQF